MERPNDEGGLRFTRLEAQVTNISKSMTLLMVALGEKIDIPFQSNPIKGRTEA